MQNRAPASVHRMAAVGEIVPGSGTGELHGIYSEVMYA
jgi:hypothetical protein